MTTVTYGVDLYGAVKKVGNTPIVTRFAMLQFLPIYPIESFYLAGVGAEKRSGVPLVFWSTTKEIAGLKLARVSRASVVVAYIRAAAALPLIMGMLGLFFGIVAGEDAGGMSRGAILDWSALIVAGAIAVGGTTYFWTYSVPAREKQIRTYCAAVLGMAADPAQFDLGTARSLVEMAKKALGQANFSDPKEALRDTASLDRHAALLLLIWARGRMAVNVDREEMDEASDRLLGVLERA